jgi:RNA polymerase sigma factor (sigma-70 family)
MDALTDQQLLCDYAGSRSEAAFSELVRRYVDLVYSAALRMVGDAHLAEDVTQSAFAVLAQNAGKLTDRPTLSGWLHRTAQNIASKTVRTNVRRRVREQEAAAMNELLAANSDDQWDHIAPHLDAALGKLSEPEREAVLLRYFERKSASEMAQILGISNEAAQKRISRAVERLREFFAGRGVTVGASGLALLLSTNAVQSAPVGLAATTCSAVLAGTAAKTSTLIAATKIIAMTTIQKVIIATTVVAAAAIGGYVVLEHQRAEKTPTAVVATGKISKQSCVFAGYATPEATFQTMLWAAARRDTNALLSSFDPASLAITEAQKNGLKGQLGLFDILTAFQVMSKETIGSPDFMNLTINVEARARDGAIDSDTLIVSMIHREDSWKYVTCRPISGHF